MRPSCLKHENGSARPVRHHNLTEYIGEVIACTVAFRSASESAAHLRFHNICYSFPKGRQRTPPGLRVSMGSGDLTYYLGGGSRASLLNAIKWKK
ncbi:hypothetical protein EVAR_103731_1 [Eumeta japonica]|uniref:Uncharacterized protein n=1 Tax=Eumeta variegata TaxID=151549 RepID=A0A4C1ZK51_EUMVA|nr:hypothetical protein EVAR_103731_1 [Eumeta japonica]